MKKVVITFATIPTQQGPVALTSAYEQVVELDVKPGSHVYVKEQNSQEAWWRWDAIQNLNVDPHGSIVKPSLVTK